MQEIQERVLGVLVADVGDDCIVQLVVVRIFLVVPEDVFLVRAIEVDAASVSFRRLEAEPDGVDLADAAVVAFLEVAILL